MAFKQKLSGGTFIIAAIAVLFFFSSLILVNTNDLFISPDETANAYFAEMFAQQGSLVGEQDQLALEFEGRIHPRSTVSVNGSLLPGSFLGLPVLYGIFAAILGTGMLWIMTPLVTLLAGFALKQVVQKVFERRIAILSFALFLLHPAIWYYSARGLMHNVLFVDLLVLSVCLWFAKPIQKQKKILWMNELLAGLLLGLALFVRTSEFSWIFLGLVALVVVFFRSLKWKQVVLGGVGIALGLSFLFGFNTLTYGGPLTTGYTVTAQSAQITSLSAQETIDTINLFPFGFHPRTTWDHFSVYFGSMFWWLTALSIIGLLVLISKHRLNKKMWGLLAAGALVFAWLSLMYGSWEIHDNPDPTQITMANSYVRYWLPLYILTIPLVALAIRWIADRAKTQMAKRLSAGALLLVIILFNFHAVFSQGQDGLLKVYETLLRSAEIQDDILFKTEYESLFVVDRADKLLFPQRRVWYPLRDDATYAALPLLVESVPVYYYGITFPEEDMDYLNNSRLGNMDLGIELVETYDQESLYQIFKK